jgi:hypothetical protein
MRLSSRSQYVSPSCKLRSPPLWASFPPTLPGGVCTGNSRRDVVGLFSEPGLLLLPFASAEQSQAVDCQLTTERSDQRRQKCIKHEQQA